MVFPAAYLVALLQFDGFEVLQFPQIPQLNNRVIGRGSQIITGGGGRGELGGDNGVCVCALAKVAR